MIEQFPSKTKCQVCNKKPEALGVNCRPGLVICLECDKRNNPFYYRGVLDVNDLNLGDTPPPLFRAVTDVTNTSHKTLGVFITRDEAQQALDDLLEEYHEGMAFEADHHHTALDNRFHSTTKIIEF